MRIALVENPDRAWREAAIEAPPEVGRQAMLRWPPAGIDEVCVHCQHEPKAVKVSPRGPVCAECLYDLMGAIR